MVTGLRESHEVIGELMIKQLATTVIACKKWNEYYLEFFNFATHVRKVRIFQKPEGQ